MHTKPVGGTVERWLPLGYFAGALLLVLVLLPSVLRTQPPEQNQSAELSPDAPPDDDSQSIISSLRLGGSGVAGAGEASGPGSGEGDAAPGGLPAAPVAVPSTRRCFGSPPRQIEDPQSPPCVPAWRGDNGGATSKGVTANEIRIAVSEPSANLDPLLERFFNSRFEFYGRQIRLVPLPAPQNNSPESQRSQAVAAADSGAFASLPYRAGGAGYEYHRELARRGVVSDTWRSTFTAAELVDHAPYIWQYGMAVDRIFSMVGQWACDRLAARPAAHAGTVDLQGATRRFGVVVESEEQDSRPSVQPAVDALEACGARPPVVATLYGNAQDPQFAATTIQRLRVEGVTSVICFCHSQGNGVLATTATSQAYFPEWIISSYLLQEYNEFLRTWWPADQRAHAFGLTMIPKQVLPENRPVRWAVRDVDPNTTVANGGTTSVDGDPDDNRYRALLLLASGIQLAGPNLTPKAFQAGLQRAVFPNPSSPIMAGSVGFAGGSHSMMLDAAEVFWSETAPDPYARGSVRGAFCYVDGGRRLRPGSDRATGSLFSEPCDSGASPG